jgi:hypothetical protein
VVGSAEQVRNQLDLNTETTSPGLIRVLQLEQVLVFVGAVRAVHVSAAVRVGRRQGPKVSPAGLSPPRLQCRRPSPGIPIGEKRSANEFALTGVVLPVGENGLHRYLNFALVTYTAR